MTRFTSILNLLGLSDRIVQSLDELKEKSYLLEPMDYTKVNEILASEKEKSLNWLKNALSAPKNVDFSSFDYLNDKIYDENNQTKCEINNEINNAHCEINNIRNDFNSNNANLHNKINVLKDEICLLKYKNRLLFMKNKIISKYYYYKFLRILTLNLSKKINEKYKYIKIVFEDLKFEEKRFF